MKAGMKGICIRVVATLLTAVLVMSLCPVIPSARAAGETYTVTFDRGDCTTAYFIPGFKNTAQVEAGKTTILPIIKSKQTGASYRAFLGWQKEGSEELLPAGSRTEAISADTKYIAKWANKEESWRELTEVCIISVDKDTGNTETKFDYYLERMNEGSSFIIPEFPIEFLTELEYIGWQKMEIIYPDTPNSTDEDIRTDEKIVFDREVKTIKLFALCEKIENKVIYHYNPPDGLSKPEGAKNDPYTTFSNKIYYVNETQGSDYGCGFIPLVGYEYLGWSTDPNAKEADSNYTPCKTISLSGKLNLYVVWKKTGYSCELNCQYYNEGETLAGSGTETVNLPAHMPREDILTYEPELEGGTYGGHHYTLTEVVTSGTVERDATNSITLRYEYDELNDEDDGQSGGDKIPDKYQRLVTYKIQNGEWMDGTVDDKTEVVTLKDGDDYSKTGTAALNKVPEGERAGAQYSETGIWSTENGRKPETVGGTDATTFTLTFLEADKAIIIKPSSNTKVTYDGKQHTFDTFEAWDINGNKLDNVVVTIKSPLPEGLCGISAGQTVDIQSWLSENGKTWNDFFTVKVNGVEISLSNNAVIFQTGEVGIAPKPLTVNMTISDTTFNDGNLGFEYEYNEDEKELTFSYRYDALEHSLSLEGCVIDGVLTGDAGGVSLCLPGIAGAPVASVGHVDDGKETIDLENLSLEGIKAGNYTIGNINVTANISGARVAAQVEKLSIQITPRPVDYWTFGGAKIYDGSPIRSDREDGTPTDQHDGEPPEHKAIDQVSVWPDYESAYDTLEGGVETRENGFIVRKEETYNMELRQNEWPGEVREFSPVDANVYLYEMAISKFMDDVTEGREPVQRDDYDIDLHYGYVTIFPQSITDDAGQISADKVLAEGEELDSFVAELLPKLPEYTHNDSAKANGLIASLRESNTYQDETDYPAIYTGVKLVDGPEASYTAPFKFEGGELRNENNAPEYQKLVEGTDYTVTYQRKNAAGEWVDTDDFSTPGTIQVTYTGIGNYRNRITKEYVLTSASEPGPGTGGGGPSVGTDDHDHYAYIIGKPGGIVDPNGKITRAEIATIIFRLLKEEVREEYWSKTNTFPDVGPRDWYNNAISTLQNLGIVEGRDDGLFHPDDPITRAEMAAMMSRLYDYDLDTGDIHTKFDDVKPDAWYARYVAAAEELGLFYGYPGDPNFYPNKNLTRAEAMTVYNRLLGRKPHRDGLLPESQMVLWPDNMDVNAWYYADVQEATNSHTCDLDGTPVGGERFERWLAPLPVRDWAALEREWSEAYSGYDGHDVN